MIKPFYGKKIKWVGAYWKIGWANIVSKPAKVQIASARGRDWDARRRSSAATGARFRVQSSQSACALRCSLSRHARAVDRPGGTTTLLSAAHPAIFDALFNKM